ncbi:DL-endopeptidase inhibitor IseA family protein [Paenibacillus rhizophilus]|nr:DL-endopeptidase inhibitor IseA family protein [Paenibacillus rhizophilus]
MTTPLTRKLTAGVLVGTLLLSGITIGIPNHASAKGLGPGQAAAIASASKTFTYKNAVYTLRLPNDWKNRLQFAEKDKQTLVYYVPESQLLQKELLFTIEAIDSAKWMDDTESGVYTALGSLNGSVYALHKSGETPYTKMPNSSDYRMARKILATLKNSLSFSFNQTQQAAPAMALVLTDARQAAELYAFGLQRRSASIQYATFSDALKKTMYPVFKELNWVTGVSSPWITKWEVTKDTVIGSSKEQIELRLDTATSTGSEPSVQLTLSLEKENGSWVIAALSSDRELPRSGVPVKKDGVPAFGSADAVSLAAKAAAHYWHIMSGGKAVKEGEIREFSIPGKGDHYRWLGEDLSTKEKLFAYLKEVYTPEKVQQYWNSQTQSGSLAIVGGRLAQPNADGGSLRDWTKAKASLLTDGAEAKTFRFDVPQGEAEHTIIDAPFRFVKGTGWRLDSEVSIIK